MQGHASFSPDRRYRYLLSRRWAPGPVVLWVMLNPSTADAERDDPTIRRCIGFSRAWGFGGMEVVNLYAIRATDSAVARRHRDPVGPENDRHIAAAAGRSEMVIAAWGAFAWAAGRGDLVLDRIGRGGVMCLGRTRSGSPRHPLYTPASTRPVGLAALATL